MTWLQVSGVIETCRYPSRSFASNGCTPPLSGSVAQVSRGPCGESLAMRAGIRCQPVPQGRRPGLRPLPRTAGPLASPGPAARRLRATREARRGGQRGTHRPATQAWPTVGHSRPHCPQLARSFCRSAQTPMRGDGQHVWPVGQPPQHCSTGMHCPLHAFSPGQHWSCGRHTPWRAPASGQNRSPLGQPRHRPRWRSQRPEQHAASRRHGLRGARQAEAAWAGPPGRSRPTRTPSTPPARAFTADRRDE